MTSLTRSRSLPRFRLAASVGSLLLLLSACSPAVPTPSQPDTAVPTPAATITAGNVSRLTELALWPVPGWVKYGLAFSPDGRQLAMAFDEGVDANTAIQLWDVTTGQRTGGLAGLRGRIEGVAFSPDSQTLAAGSSSQMVKLWQLPSGQSSQVWTLPAQANSLAFAPDGKVLAIGLFDGTVQLREASSGQVLRTLAAHTSLVSAVAFSPDGTRLATGSFDTSLKLWDASSGQALRQFSGHQHPVERVAWAPDGQTLASASSDGTVRLWDPATGQARAVLSDKSVLEWFDVDFSADGTVVAAASQNALGLWETASGRALRTIGTTGESIGVDTAAFSPNGKLLATGGDHAVRLWGVP